MDDARYPSTHYSLNRQKRSQHSRPRRDFSYEEAEFEEENDDVEDDVQEADDNPDVYYRRLDESELFGRFPKRQRSASGFQFTPDSVKLAYDWTEDEAAVLLEVWGDRFLQLGRRSLRGEDWVDVAEKVSEALKIEKTEAQCRQMIDALKRKYKKEKVKVERTGFNSSKWPFFKKMEMLLGLGSSSILQQECGLACGVDSGEFVFMDIQVYLDKSNGFDEMRDSPGDSEVDEDADEGKDGGSRRRDENEEASMRMLADSVQRFGRIYEKIESSKREHMRELERMRMDFQRELELQKKQILDRAQSEIAKISEEEGEETDEDEDNNDDSSENHSEYFQ